jgi:hypothetical protein
MMRLAVTDPYEFVYFPVNVFQPVLVGVTVFPLTGTPFNFKLAGGKPTFADAPSVSVTIIV